MTISIYESRKGMYQFDYLPSYATFLLQHLDAYTEDLIELSFSIDVPLLRFLRHLSKEELFSVSKTGSQEFLSHLAQNQMKAFISSSMERWLSNQLQLVGKYDIQARDITLVSHVRSKVMKSWITRYTSDIDTILHINREIDELMLGYNTTSTDAYIQILKEKIEEESSFNTHLVGASPGIIFIYDLEQGKEVYINGRVQEVLGVTPEEVLGTPNLIMELSHPDDIPVITAFLERVIGDTEGNIQQAEYRFRDKRGEYHWLRTYAVVYKRKENGQPTQILGAAYEITNEKETATALLKREQQLLEAQAIGQIGSFDWDIINDLSVSTPQLQKIFEADKRQTFKEMLQNVHPEDQQKLASAVETAFVTGDLNCDYRYLTPVGEKIIHSKGKVMFDKDGKPLTMTGTIQDITARKRAEESLLQKTMELERSNEQLQQFASIASHDLKEPLRKISMFSNLIMTTDWETLPDRTKHNLQKISDAVVRMHQLVEGILAYSSLTTQVLKEVVNLEKVLQEALINLEYRIKETHATITSDGLPEAAVVPFQMQQLFQNLIGNALKFIKKEVPPIIQITHKILPREELTSRSLEAASTYLQIEVSDNGIGFGQEAVERIFGLFQRLHGKAIYEGTGLGLAICRRIIENHGGSIAAKGEDGIGATFTIVLPLTSPKPNNGSQP